MTGLDYFQTVKVVGLASDNAGILAPAQAFVAPTPALVCRISSINRICVFCVFVLVYFVY